MIAFRTLNLRQPDGSTLPVPVRLFAPEEDNGAWYCAIEIDWPEGRRTQRAYGVDSVQALQIGLQMIGLFLYLSDHHREGRLFFEAPGRGYGFPVPSNMREVLVGDDRKDFGT